jgi:hypothetical protein
MTIAKARAVMSVFMIRLRRLRITVADAGTGRLALSRKVGQAKGALFPRLLTRDACQRTGMAHESGAAQSRPISRSNSQPTSSWSSICNLQKRSAMKFRPAWCSAPTR